MVPPPGNQPGAYFTNGRRRRARRALRAALRPVDARRLVPAGKTADRAGHHHLLVNQPLPLDFKKPLPFTEKYIHFGKGQMEHVVDLPPGTYTLNLLLADRGHIPYFVYSKPVRVTIKSQRKVAAAELTGAPRVEILQPANAASVRAPVRVQFHAVGHNVSHAGARAADTGHFRLSVLQAGKPPQVLAFRGGQTEVWLNPPKGDYQLKLDLVSNQDPARVLATTPVQALAITGTAPPL
ncbi:DUF4399 domain-containing protein [Ramlibacter terrae]|uniref:DUF4399 domain-containing protein n=1 Tax=Ramlibacter terrae TaxID=2732511 RepID=A0ABX6P710_9BURK|nr:DUF4399 domain-containing protein [Ramlibacter terrae]